MVGTYGRQLMHDHKNISFLDQYGNEKKLPSHYTSTMGHAIIHLQCLEPNKYDKWVSMTGQANSEQDRDLLLRQRLGLGVLFHNFTDGEIIVGRENEIKLSTYKSTATPPARPRCITFPLSQKACGEAKEMAEFYISFNSYLQASKLDPNKPRDLSQINHFGLIDPYKAWKDRTTQSKRLTAGDTGACKSPESPILIGGGCAPFAIGLMKAAGVYDSMFLEHKWRTQLKISKGLIKEGSLTGEQIKEFCRGEGDGFSKEVYTSFTGLGPRGDSWTESKYGSCEVNLYDPNRIWEFLGKANQCIGVGAGDCNEPGLKDWLNKNKFKTCDAITFTSPPYTKVKRRGGHKNNVRIERQIVREQNVATQICADPAT